MQIFNEGTNIGLLYLAEKDKTKQATSPKINKIRTFVCSLYILKFRFFF